MRVIDSSNQIWHTQILTQKFKGLAEGQYIRVRQATLQNHKNYHRVFGLKMHSNILVLPTACRLSKEMFLRDEECARSYEYKALTAGLTGDAAQKSITSSLPHPLIITE